MILYTVTASGYIDYAEYLRQMPAGNCSVYVNLTNDCSCSCTFCLRNTKMMDCDNTLWLEKAPEAATVIAEFAQYDLAKMREIVFCGFGEPTMRLDTLLEVARYLKGRSAMVKIRLNTNGLGELVHKKAIAPLLAGLIDTISISLNASNAAEYLRLTQNKFGLPAYDAMLKFAQSCKLYIPQVILSVVDCIGIAEITACQDLCDNIGINLRVRPFE